MRDEEQHVVAAQEHALDGEEVAGDDARRARQVTSGGSEKRVINSPKRRRPT
jgi:hypothetical protein